MMEQKDDVVVHVVKKTDTLMGIAIHYGITPHDLKKANKMWNDNVQVRKTLNVPLSLCKSREDPQQASSSSSSSSRSSRASSFAQHPDEESQGSSRSGGSTVINHTAAPTGSRLPKDSSIDSLTSYLRNMDAEVEGIKANLKIREDLPAYLESNPSQKLKGKAVDRGEYSPRSSEDEGRPRTTTHLEQQPRERGWTTFEPMKVIGGVLDYDRRNLEVQRKKMEQAEEDLFEL